MVVVGADGYPGGWVLYSINVQSFATQVEVTHDLASLLRRSRPADMAALGIDLPIGLLDRPRACDLAARKLLGVRGCCVFLAPSRAAVYAEHYSQASELNQERAGRRLSKHKYARWLTAAQVRLGNAYDRDGTLRISRAVECGLRFAASKRPVSYFGKLAVSHIQSAAPAEVVPIAYM